MTIQEFEEKQRAARAGLKSLIQDMTAAEGATVLKVRQDSNFIRQYSAEILHADFMLNKFNIKIFNKGEFVADYTASTGEKAAMIVQSFIDNGWLQLN